MIPNEHRKCTETLQRTLRKTQNELNMSEKFFRKQKTKQDNQFLKNTRSSILREKTYYI
jgi:hypothetical protein